MDELSVCLKKKDPLKHRFDFISLWLTISELSWAELAGWLIRNDNRAPLELHRSARSHSGSRITAKRVQVSFLNNKVKHLSGSQFQLLLLYTKPLPDSLSLVHSKLVIQEPDAHRHATGASLSQVRIFFFYTRNKRGHFTAVPVKPMPVVSLGEMSTMLPSRCTIYYDLLKVTRILLPALMTTRLTTTLSKAECGKSFSNLSIFFFVCMDTTQTILCTHHSH